METNQTFSLRGKRDKNSMESLENPEGIKLVIDDKTLDISADIFIDRMKRDGLL